MVKNKSTTIEEYIHSKPPEVQEALRKIYGIIKEAAPDAEEGISYGIPTFKLNGNLVHFAAHTRHIGFYPEPSAIEAFREELTHYETSKGAIKIPLDQTLPADLIRRIVIFRLQENLGK
jgi:uncharacterized protein YdhG (YjbR/CyaY superfamily)